MKKKMVSSGESNNNCHNMPSKIVMSKVVTLYMILKLVIYFTFKPIVSIFNVLPYQ